MKIFFLFTFILMGNGAWNQAAFAQHCSPACAATEVCCKHDGGSTGTLYECYASSSSCAGFGGTVVDALQASDGYSTGANTTSDPPIIQIKLNGKPVGWIASTDLAQLLKIPNRGALTANELTQDQYKTVADFIQKHGLSDDQAADAYAKLPHPRCSVEPMMYKGKPEPVSLSAGAGNHQPSPDGMACGKKWPAVCTAKVSCEDGATLNGQKVESGSHLTTFDPIDGKCPTSIDQILLSSNRPSGNHTSRKATADNDLDSFGHWEEVRIVTTPGSEEMCVGTYKKAGSADFSFSTTPPAVNGECKMSDSKADTCTTPYTGGAYYTSATYSADYLAQTGGRGTPKPGSAEPAK